MFKLSAISFTAWGWDITILKPYCEMRDNRNRQRYSKSDRQETKPPGLINKSIWPVN